MSAIDDLDFLDSFGDEDPFYDGEEVTCERCGETELLWELTYVEGKPKWILIDSNNAPHQCPPSSADEFDVEPT